MIIIYSNNLTLIQFFSRSNDLHDVINRRSMLLFVWQSYWSFQETDETNKLILHQALDKKTHVSVNRVYKYVRILYDCMNPVCVTILLVWTFCVSPQRHCSVLFSCLLSSVSGYFVSCSVFVDYSVNFIKYCFFTFILIFAPSRGGFSFLKYFLDLTHHLSG